MGGVYTADIHLCVLEYTATVLLTLLKEKYGCEKNVLC